MYCYVENVETQESPGIKPNLQSVNNWFWNKKVKKSIEN